jgi:WD40 repeat protein
MTRLPATCPSVIPSLQDGTLTYLKPSAAAEADAAPAARIVGHQAAMHFIDVDPSTGEIVTGDVAGRVCVWRPTDEAHTVYTATVLKGDVPTKKVAGVTGRGGEVAVVSWDDKLRIGEAASNALKAAVAMPGQPKGIAVAASNPKIKVVVTGSAIVVVDGAAAPVSTPAVFGPTCVDISADGSVVAVGGKDRKIHVYKLAAGVLTADGETKEFGGELSVVAVHPDGSAVAGGDAVRDVRLYSTGADKAAIRVGRWVYHTTRVTGLKWSPNGRHLVSVSTDRRLCVWDPNSDAPKLSIDLANPAPFAAVAWADDNTVWTVGIDGVALRRSLAL